MPQILICLVYTTYIDILYVFLVLNENPFRTDKKTKNKFHWNYLVFVNSGFVKNMWWTRYRSVTSHIVANTSSICASPRIKRIMKYPCLKTSEKARTAWSLAILRPSMNGTESKSFFDNSSPTLCIIDRKKGGKSFFDCNIKDRF